MISCLKPDSPNIICKTVMMATRDTTTCEKVQSAAGAGTSQTEILRCRPGHNMNLPSAARDGVHFCDKLFYIEEKLEHAALAERLRVRNIESRPITEEFYASHIWTVLKPSVMFVLIWSTPKDPSRFSP